MGLVGKGRRLLEVLQQGVLKHVLRLRALVEVGAGQPQHRVPVPPQRPRPIGLQAGRLRSCLPGQQRPQPGQRPGRAAAQQLFHRVFPLSFHLAYKRRGPTAAKKISFLQRPPALVCLQGGADRKAARLKSRKDDCYEAFQRTAGRPYRRLPDPHRPGRRGMGRGGRPAPPHRQRRSDRNHRGGAKRRLSRPRPPSGRVPGVHRGVASGGRDRHAGQRLHARHPHPGRELLSGRHQPGRHGGHDRPLRPGRRPLCRGRRHLRPPGAVRGAHGQSGGGRHRGGRRRGADDPAARGRRAASEPVAGMRLPGGAGAGRRISRAPARAPRGVYACAVPGHPRLPGRGALHRRRRHPSLPGRPRRRGRERRLQRLSRHLERGGRRRVRHLQGSGRDGIARPLGAGRIQLLPLL